MTILGTYTKQPIEVEFYSVQFVRDMADTDEATSGYQVITHNGKSLGTLIINAGYAATLGDDHKTIRTTDAVALPGVAPEGFTLYIGNVNQNAGIYVGAWLVPARGSIIVVRCGGTWCVEASANGILVSAPGDQRMRVQMAGGVDKKNYKIEATIGTAEGRVLQNEILVKVRED
jgi:hypothetical protein